MTTTSFRKEQLVTVKDGKDSEFYKAKVVEVDEKLGEFKVHYVGWNNRYDEAVPLASSRIEEWHAESSVAVQSSAWKTPLSAAAVPCGSEACAVRDSVPLFWLWGKFHPETLCMGWMKRLFLSCWMIWLVLLISVVVNIGWFQKRVVWGRLEMCQRAMHNYCV